VTTLVFSLARPNSQTQPTTHTEYPHTPTDSHALQNQIALTSSLQMSGPDSSNLNPLEYQVRGNARVLIQAAMEVKNSFPVKCTYINSVCFTGESH